MSKNIFKWFRKTEKTASLKRKYQQTPIFLHRQTVHHLKISLNFKETFDIKDCSRYKHMHSYIADICAQYYCCHLKNPKGNNLSSSNRYNHWKHISHLLMEYENSSQQKQSMMKYVARSKTTRLLNNRLIFRYNAQVNNWKNIFKELLH